MTVFKYINGEEELVKKLEDLLKEKNTQEGYYRKNYTVRQLRILVREHGYISGCLKTKDLINILTTKPKRQAVFKKSKGRPPKKFVYML